MVAVRVILPVMTTRGERITARREQLDWSRAELARRVGCSPAYISQIESGERNGSHATLAAIAAALSVPLDALESDEPLPPPPAPRIPMEGEIRAGGVVKSAALRQVLIPSLRANRAPLTDSESIEAPPDVDSAHAFAIPIGPGLEAEKLFPGASLICETRRKPKEGDLVLATDADDTKVRLMRYRVVDSEPMLWPLADSAAHPIRLSVGDWRVIAVAAGQWHPF